MKCVVISSSMPFMNGYTVLSTRKIAPGVCRARVRVGTYVLEVEGTTSKFRKLDNLGTNELIAELMDRVPKRARVTQQPALPVAASAQPQQSAAVEAAAAKQLLDELGITELIQALPQQPQQAAAQQDPDWTCACGKQNAGTACFCAACGKQKPQPQPAPAGWTCTCGAANAHDAAFCTACGTAKPKPQPTLQDLMDAILQIKGNGSGKPNGNK